MPVTLRLRASNQDNALTAPVEVDVVCAAVTPDLETIGENATRLDLSMRGTKGGRMRYSVVSMPFTLADYTTVTGGWQDHGDYVALKQALTLYRYRWIYSVTGSTRVDGDDDPYWEGVTFPISVVVDGQPLAAVGMNGLQTLDFDLLGTAVSFS